MTQTKNIFQKEIERNRLKEDIEKYNFISSSNLFKFYKEELRGEFDQNIFNEAFNMFIYNNAIIPDLNIEQIYNKALVHYRINFLYDREGNFIKVV